MELLKKLVILSMVVLSGCAYLAGVREERQAAAAPPTQTQGVTVIETPAKAAPDTSSASSNANTTAAKMLAPLTQ